MLILHVSKVQKARILYIETEGVVAPRRGFHAIRKGYLSEANAKIIPEA